MKKRTTSHALQFSAPFYLALLLLLLAVPVSLYGGWSWYRILRASTEQDLDQRMIALAQAAEITIAESAQFTMQSLQSDDLPEAEMDWVIWFNTLVEYDTYLTITRLSTHLEQLIETGGLDTVVLISPQAHVIYDAQHPQNTGKAMYEVRDDPAWLSALNGKATAMPFSEQYGEPQKTIYVPVRLFDDETGQDTVGAVLRLEARSAHFETIKQIRSQVITLAIIVTLIVTLVAIVFFRLIRMLVQVEKSAAHHDRLQAMGAMTANIAHEIRNPLGIIRVLAESLRADLDEADQAIEMVDDIVDEVKRLNTLVTHYLQFARPDSAIQGPPANLAELLPELVKLIQKGHDVSIKLELEQNLPAVTINTSALRQVLLNLLMNAQQANHQNKTIELSCSAIRNNTQVEIRVRDKGTGIAARDLKRVFDPFFTSRTDGSGLGLPICRHLIEDCQGSLEIDSEPGCGTSVRIILPATEQ